MARGDPNPTPVDGFSNKPDGSSFKRSFLHKSDYKENRDAKGARMRDHLVAATGEFVGTFFFLWLAFAWQLIAINQQPSTATNGGPSAEQIMYISVGYGFSLLVCAWAFYRISGGLFNPAVSFVLFFETVQPVLISLFPGRPWNGFVCSTTSHPWCSPPHRRIAWVPRRFWSRSMYVSW